jgi:hypothetical protein
VLGDRLVQNIQANGYKIVYDVKIFLYHYISERQQYDKRNDLFSELNYYKTLNVITTQNSVPCIRSFI